jgi:two-component system phosphate regulon sensor histidine kinase PhoR
MSSPPGGLDRRRLRLGLAAFFLALAVPSALLVYHAFGQIEWEGFHQQQVLAEELALRIDARLTALVDAESARGSADYGFLVVEGDPRAGYLQRSPLAAYPPSPDIPGLIGYFQVDARGDFSSPLLPQGAIDPTAYGLTEAEVRERAAAEIRLEQILSSNRLVDQRRGEGIGRKAATAAAMSDAVEGSLSSEVSGELARHRPAAAGGVDLAQPSPDEVPKRDAQHPATAAPPGDAQAAFDRLNAAPIRVKDKGSATQAKAGKAEAPAQGLSKTETAEAGLGGEQAGRRFAEATTQALAQTRGQRQSRRELVVIPEAKLGSGAQGEAAPAPARPPAPTPPVAAIGTASRVQAGRRHGLPSLPAEVVEHQALAKRPPIRTFESEIDPFEFSRLASGELVLYRKLWRDGQRYTQGALIDPGPFIRTLIGTPFAAAALASTSDLAVSYRNDPIALLPGGGDATGRDYGSRTQALRGTPLYQMHLSAPLGDLGIAFAVNRLPLGPGTKVVAWVAGTLALVLIGGIWGLYWLGLRQIALVGQQQDFVSAVSHELKTPLTSIRMYSEMLREGWVSGDKQQAYYAFIHDESERLSRLIANVLQLARMTRNEQHLDLRPMTCAELTDLARSKIASRVEGAGFTLRLDCPDEVGGALVSTDPDAFAQILINLVDNAVKFSAKADVKVVDIGCERRRGGGALFRVRDYGPGVPRDQIRKIFRLFYRGEGALTRETLGTGIGLALAQGLAHAMGGTVDLVNREPGAEFRLILPDATEARGA